MANIPITDSRLEAALKPLINKGKNLKPLMRAIAGIMNFAVEENFKTEGRRLKKGWTQLSNKTIKERTRKKKWPGKILNRHGASGLSGSINQKWEERSAQIGSNKAYAAIHQFGGTINRAARSEIFERLRNTRGARKNKFKKLADDRAVKKGFSFKAYSVRIPARPFLELNKNDIKKIEDAVGNWLSK